eukprot:765256-Prorocentrum_minimum.AAC.1
MDGGEMEHTQSLLSDCASIANKLTHADGPACNVCRAQTGVRSGRKWGTGQVERTKADATALQAELVGTSEELLTIQEEVIRMNAQ